MKTLQNGGAGTITLSRVIKHRIAQAAEAKGLTFDETFRLLVVKGLQAVESEARGKCAAAPDDADLSSRQRAVLEGLRNGLAVKEIADKLGVSEITVRTHILRIRERLSCPDLLKLRIPDS